MKRRMLAGLMLACGWLVAPVQGHELQPGYLSIRETSQGQYDVLWKGPALGSRRSLDLDLEFSEDVEVVDGPVAGRIDDAEFQFLRIRRDGGLAGASIGVPGLSELGIHVLLRIEHGDGSELIRRLTAKAPVIVVDAEPGISQLAWTYLMLGVEHILLGLDHLLFVLGLLLLVGRRWMLVKTITAFTIAHSVTLALSVFAVIRVPAEPLNAAIALSILFLGPEIVRKWRGGDSLTIRHPCVVAFGFGLLHGIGFASGLSMTGIPQSGIPLALLFFNLGVEVGQLAFVVLALLVARAIRSLQLDRPVWVPRIPAYLVGTLGAFWTIQRVSMMIS